MGESAFRVVRVLGLGLAATCALGCATTGARLSGPPLDRGTVIGGGFDISFYPPGCGTVYLVDAETGKCLYSKALGGGRDLVHIDEAEFGPMAEMGLDINSINPVLYYVPRE